MAVSCDPKRTGARRRHDNLGVLPIGSEDLYEMAWARQLGTASSDMADSAAVDGAGNVYISGRTKGDLGNANEGDSDAFLGKYDASGNLL